MRVRRLRAWLARSAGLLRRAERERELAEELEVHLQMQVEDNLRAGMSPREARRRALVKLGGLTQAREECRRRSGFPMLEDLWQDVRYGLRTLARRKGFTLAAVASLALGIGACTAVFSVVDGVLLRPLPYLEPGRILELREVSEKGAEMPFAEPNYLDLRASGRSLEALAQYRPGLTSVLGGSEPARARVTAASGDFFRVMGVGPAAGRTFDAGEAGGDAGRVAVVSHGFWQRMMGGRRDFDSVALNIYDWSFTVVGVMPPGFDYPRGTEVWIPREVFPAQTSRTAHNWSVVGRLRPGVGVEEARADLKAFGGRLKAEHGGGVDAVAVTAVPLQEFMVGDVRGLLFILLGAVGLLLLIACANVANLLLAQATARRKEVAVRAALGATRLRLLRQFVTECVLLTLISGALGVLLAYWGVDAIVALNAGGLPRAEEVGVDVRALAVALGLALVTALALGLTSAMRCSDAGLQHGLRDSGRGQTSGPGGSRLRGALVVSQVALTLVLTAGAALLGKSFLQLLSVDPGFRPESAVAMSTSLPTAKDDEQRRRQVLFHEQLLERLRQIPGAVAAGGVNSLPITGGGSSGTFLIDNDPSRTGYAEYRIASRGYFEAMGIPLLQGRPFSEDDRPDSTHVAVISQSLARKVWPGESPLGQRIQFGNMDGDKRLLHVVGVVGDVRERGLDADVRPTVYAYAPQRPLLTNFSYIIRAGGEASALASAARAELRALDPNIPARVRTLEEVVSASLDSRRFSLVIFAVFAGAALALAVTGVYGVMSYAVAQRTHEIGVRVALGARRRDILGLVLGRGMRLTLFGVAAGALGAAASTRLMSGLLYGVSPNDPLSLLAVSALLVAVAFLACLIPAYRATKVDPVVALKAE
ncbi:MAG TPA: ABC transporter permease [Pyrinomonadaceae bacterium]|jgi:predicted permease|nr:ABC transporter permease [Pyrinomonadaceae bacterium]